MKENKLVRCLEGFSFLLPTRIEYGVGVSKGVAEEVVRCQGSKVMIVTDPGVEQAGLVQPIAGQLSRNNIPFIVFNEVEANPRAETVNRGAQIARAEGVDTIVAIGGGSSLDGGKGIAAVHSHGGDIRDYEGVDRLRHPVTPVIAIPTTAGTGSEVTFWAVITDPKRKVKIAIGGQDLAPRVALVDPGLTLTLPQSITAATGLDALTHAIEGYTAKCSNPISDAIALYAMELITQNIGTAVQKGTDMEARGGMMLGSLLAGIAFGTSDTGGVHCMAEALGGMFDVPHGVANAMFLPYVMGYNLPAVPEKTRRIGLALGVPQEGNEPLERRTVLFVKDLCQELNIPTLGQLGITGDDLPPLAKRAYENPGTVDNARDIDEEGFLALYHRALTGGELF